jgi:chloride channel protein, CIC family
VISWAPGTWRRLAGATRAAGVRGTTGTGGASWTGRVGGASGASGTTGVGGTSGTTGTDGIDGTNGASGTTGTARVGAAGGGEPRERPRPQHLVGRVRVPPPLISRRIPSGRGATEQPNAAGDGDAALTPVFWLMVVLTGIAAGLFGDLMMLLLFSIQHLAFGYHTGSLEAAVERVSDVRRLVVLLIAGAFGGVAWFLLRRYTKGEKSELDDVVWGEGQRLSFRRSLGTSLISEIVIGMGASIGRENAPKLMGGASASILAGWAGLTPAQRRLLMACGGGAGLAAVYNVPLGGALFTAEVMLGSVSVPVVLPALACSWIATATAWLYLPNRATYVDVPNYRFTVTLLVWALLAGPLIGLVAVGYIRLMGWISHHQASGRVALFAPAVAFGILGLIAFAYPQLLGNGKDMAHDAFLGVNGLTLLLALFALKPLVTALCLGSGASGGLFTPTLSTGAMLGGAAGIVWSLAWPGSPAGAYALVGAAAMLGAAMQAPLAGLVLILELTHGGFALSIPMIAATVTATAVARYIDGYSIYSARLRARPRPPDPAPGPESPGRAVAAAPEPVATDPAVAQHGLPRRGPAAPRVPQTPQTLRGPQTPQTPRAPGGQQRAGGHGPGRLGRRN